MNISEIQPGNRTNNTEYENNATSILNALYKQSKPEIWSILLFVILSFIATAIKAIKRYNVSSRRRTIGGSVGAGIITGGGSTDGSNQVTDGANSRHGEAHIESGRAGDGEGRAGERTEQLDGEGSDNDNGAERADSSEGEASGIGVWFNPTKGRVSWRW